MRVAKGVDLTALAGDPVALVARGRRGADHVGDVFSDPREAAVEGRITEAEDAAVTRHHPVALAGWAGADAVDRLVQSEASG